MVHSVRSRRSPLGRFTLVALVPAVLFLASCRDSESGPTAPPVGATATLQGTVVLGSASARLQPRAGIGLGGVTVRVSGTDRATATDGAGNFRLDSIPVGTVELQFERADIHARGQVSLAAGTHGMTFSIVGSRAVASPRAHADEEIEGLVQAIDAGAGTLTVLDQRLGAVRIVTNSDTLVRRGDSPIALSDVAVGMRVHAKALAQDDGAYLATELLLQSEKVGGMREVSGTIAALDSGASAFTVDAGGTSVVVETDAGTDYKRRGGRAAFADLTVGAAVQVKGILQADGHVLARQVRIES